MRRAVLAVTAAVLLLAPVALARHSFADTEPLAAKEWYLEADNAWSFWPTAPTLAPVRVAVIDSGIDASHPEFVGRVAAAKSFVGGSPYTDEQGHGTFVAGEIAANPFNQLGMAGLAFNAQLLVAKVVAADGSVPLKAEVAAIRWAADNGARVINLSLGGVRDPLNSRLDTYSPLEQAAIGYAYSKGAVVIAAVGNGPQSPKTPWSYADYPAALPHVVGVSAIRQDGSVPGYSNRDAIFVDLAAPGDGIFSTIPENLTASGCADGPYSDCGPAEFRDAIGTSFAAPQVSAAAALILGQDPRLTPDQLSWLLERSASDESAATGCTPCPLGRDTYTGWGRLDIQAALTDLTTGTPLPPPDRFEPNDDGGSFAHAVPPLPRTISATLDYWDDQIDVYRVVLKKGQRLYARLTPQVVAATRMALWRPGTQRVEGLDVDLTSRLAQSTRAGTQERLAYTARVSGTYYIEAKLVAPAHDPVSYRLSLVRKRA